MSYESRFDPEFDPNDDGRPIIDEDDAYDQAYYEGRFDDKPWDTLTPGKGEEADDNF